MLVDISTKLSTHIMPLRDILNFLNMSNANVTYERSPEMEVTLLSLNVTV
jgi:hypothetical protein